MKDRSGFVSNSSSTSFIITNKTNKALPLLEFVQENLDLIDEFNLEYNWHNYSYADALGSVGCYDYILCPGKNECTFGDEDGNPLGNIYDYALRDGGSSERFSWRFNEFLR